MPKFLRTGAALLTVAVLACLVGFVHARVSGGPAENARPWMYGLLVCFGVMALAAAYMALVGYLNDCSVSPCIKTKTTGSISGAFDVVLQ